MWVPFPTQTPVKDWSLRGRRRDDDVALCHLLRPSRPNLDSRLLAHPLAEILAPLRIARVYDSPSNLRTSEIARRWVSPWTPEPKIPSVDASSPSHVLRRHRTRGRSSDGSDVGAVHDGHRHSTLGVQEKYRTDNHREAKFLSVPYEGRDDLDS